MAQALGKVNMSPKLRNCFLKKKIVILFQNSVFGEIQFSQKFLTHKEKKPHTLLQGLVRQVRNVPEKTKIQKTGARGDRGSPDQNERAVSDLWYA